MNQTGAAVQKTHSGNLITSSVPQPAAPEPEKPEVNAPITPGGNSRRVKNAGGGEPAVKAAVENPEPALKVPVDIKDRAAAAIVPAADAPKSEEAKEPEALKAQNDELAKKLEESQASAKEFKAKLAEAQKTGENLALVAQNANDIVKGTIDATLAAKSVLELFNGKVQEANRIKNEAEAIQGTLKRLEEKVVKKETEVGLAFEKIEAANKQLQVKQEALNKADEDLRNRLQTEAQKAEENRVAFENLQNEKDRLTNETGSLKAQIQAAGKGKNPLGGIKLADISNLPDSEVLKENASKYFLNKLFSGDKLAAFKAEYDKIADDKFPGVTKESFARFLAREVSTAFGKVEHVALTKANPGEEKVIFETLKRTVIEKLQAGIPGLDKNAEAQFISFVGTAIGALEGPLKLLKEAPDHSWRNRILRTLSVELLAGVGSFVYRGPIEGVIFSNLPKEGLDLLAAISSTGSELYQSSIDLGLPEFIVGFVSKIAEYVGDPTVPLLCTVLVAVFYFIFDWIVSLLLRQKAKTEDEVIETLIAKNVQLVRV